MTTEIEVLLAQQELYLFMVSDSNGGLRYYANFSRGGTPAHRAFIVGASFASDTGTRLLQNAINDPNYIKTHVTS